MKPNPRKFSQQLDRLLISPGLEPAQQAARIHVIERDIILPIKALVILVLIYYFYFSGWLDQPQYLREVAFETIRKLFLVYIGVNLLAAWGLLRFPQMQLAKLQWIVYISSLLDGMLFAALSFVTGGFDSIVYWMFPALILRNAISIPHVAPQVGVNFSVCACYLAAGLFDVTAAKDEEMFLDLGTRQELSIGLSENPTEPFLMRVLILLLWTLCCYGVQSLVERHRRAVAEAVEFATRQEQLQTAGRLAAEIAHRMKNPLSIINNAAFVLERSWKAKSTEANEQIEIIREEVDKSDRILTELMGYAQLAEGRVEKLSVIEEMERALHDVFPAAAKYQVEIFKDYAEDLPPLLMQRGHVYEVFMNILTNAREAMEGKGRLDVTIHHGADYCVEVMIADSGPGIPLDKRERIFEAYFSTKEKGTGLGLSIVKHNLEIYGGTVRVESELGKGARFLLEFPVKSVMKFNR